MNVVRLLRVFFGDMVLNCYFCSGLLGLLFTVYGLRFTVYSLRFTVYGLQFTVYSLQFTV